MVVWVVVGGLWGVVVVWVGVWGVVVVVVWVGGGLWLYGLCRCVCGCVGAYGCMWVDYLGCGHMGRMGGL